MADPTPAGEAMEQARAEDARGSPASAPSDVQPQEAQPAFEVPNVTPLHQKPGHIAVNMPFERVPQSADDSGFGPAPTSGIVERLRGWQKDRRSKLPEAGDRRNTHYFPGWVGELFEEAADKIERLRKAEGVDAVPPSDAVASTTDSSRLQSARLAGYAEGVEAAAKAAETMEGYAGAEVSAAIRSLTPQP